MENTTAILAKAQWRGEEVYGMVDGNFNVDGKQMFGFVFATPNMWVGFLTTQYVECEDAEEINEALQSARLYWRCEFESLTRRAEMKYDIDDQEHLAKLIKIARDWCDRLG